MSKQRGPGSAGEGGDNILKMAGRKAKISGVSACLEEHAQRVKWRTLVRVSPSCDTGAHGEVLVFASADSRGLARGNGIHGTSQYMSSDLDHYLVPCELGWYEISQRRLELCGKEYSSDLTGDGPGAQIALESRAEYWESKQAMEGFYELLVKLVEAMPK